MSDNVIIFLKMVLEQASTLLLSMANFREKLILFFLFQGNTGNAAFLDPSGGM